MAATARHGAMGHVALLKSAGLSRYLASNFSYDAALTVDPPGVQPGDSRTLGHTPFGALVECPLASQSTSRHFGSFTEFPRGYLPA